MSEQAGARTDTEAERAPERIPGEAAPHAIAAFEAYGLELEYMLVDSESLDVRSIADAAFELAGAPPGSGDLVRGMLGWSNELVRHVVELKNLAPRALVELAGRFEAEISRFNALLATRGARLMPGGMHPWMDPTRESELWPYGNSPVYEAYHRIFDCRAHGWANLQSAHINLPFADDAEFARLHAAVRVVLPLIPALAASSPYANGCAPGPLDYRMAVYRDNSLLVPSLTGKVIPETCRTRAEYEEEVLRPMYRDIAPLDPGGVLQHEWLNSRGAIARFTRNAIEIRVMDVQECPLADVALAALVVDAVQALYEQRYAPLSAQQALSTDALSRVLAACVEDGELGEISDSAYLGIFGLRRRVTAGDLWLRIAERLEATGSRHHALWAVPVDVILAHGPLARRLLTALGPQPRRADMRNAYRELCACLDTGRMYIP